MKKINILLIITLSLIPVVSLFHSGLPITHDGQDHVARIANFYQNLKEGVIIPRWAANLNWGYGHPILIFLYPLPSYLASLFHAVGFSLIDSTKIVFGLGMTLSLVFMYMWLFSFLDRTSAIFGAVLYTYAPYRFVELYVRGDIGENLAFAFIPLTLFFIYKLYNKQSYIFVISGGISLAFLILSHNAISLMLMPFILAYCFYLIWLSKFNKYLILNALLLIIIGFSFSSFFWIPGLFEGKYTLRNIVTAGGYIGRFTSLKDLFYGPWSYGGSGQFTVQLGIVHWLSLIVSPIVGFYFYRKRNKNLLLVLGLMAYTLIAIFLMIPISSFVWERIMLLQNFQFPWRFLAIIVFTTSLLGAFLMEFLPKKYKLGLLSLFIILVLFFSKDYMRSKGYLYKPESFYTGIYESTTDTGESSPRWSVRFMEKRPKARIEVIEGNAQIEEIKRTTTKHQYKIIAFQRSQILENTLYFPGWEIMVYDEKGLKVDNKKVEVEFQDLNYRGLQTFLVEPGTYEVLVRFGETRLRKLADIISLLAIIAIFIPFVLQRRLKKLRDGLL